MSHLDISNDISLKNSNAMKWGLSNLLQFVISNHADLDLVMPRNYIQKGKNELCKYLPIYVGSKKNLKSK